MAAAAGTGGLVFKPPKVKELTEKETITSFDSWLSNLLYHLSLNNEFAPYLEGEWAPKSTANHGFIDDTEAAVPDVRFRKTAVQKSILLDRMLGLIAQFAPSLLRKEILNRATSLSWIWNRIRRYYSFSKSEVNFLKLSAIKLEEDERYETLFQRIVAHLDDNLLTAGSTLNHDGVVPTEDELLSPTAERLAVYLWLVIIDKRLPAYISREYAHQLQTMTLKDIQPRLAENMESILQSVSAAEDIQVNYNRSNRYNPGRKPSVSFKDKPTPTPRKVCILCRASGRPHVGHDASNCWFTSKHEKQQFTRALLVELDALEADTPNDTSESAETSISFVTREVAIPPTTDQQPPTPSVIRKVQSAPSPIMYAFCGHTPCQVLLDSGAMSSLVSKSFLKRAGVDTKPTNHFANGANKKPIELQGEVHLTIQFDDMNLPLSALVVEKLDCDILGGVPFGIDHDVNIYLKEKAFSIHGRKYPYGAQTPIPVQNIYRVESTSYPWPFLIL